MNIDGVKQMIEKSVELFLSNDVFLLEQRVNERSVTHKLAECFKSVFTDTDYDVDCEYNKMKGIDTHDYFRKRISIDSVPVPVNDEDAKTVFPDIVVHKRDSSNPEDCLLAVEVKYSDSTINKIEWDFKKLDAFMKPRSQTSDTVDGLGYQFTAFIEFSNNRPFEPGKWYNLEVKQFGDKWLTG